MARLGTSATKDLNDAAIAQGGETGTVEKVSSLSPCGVTDTSAEEAFERDGRVNLDMEPEELLTVLLKTDVREPIEEQTAETVDDLADIPRPAKVHFPGIVWALELVNNGELTPD